MRDKALELMAECKHCTISTIGPDGKPQSAFVGFSEDKELGLLIGTYKDSRKFANILNNPNVSVVIADEDKRLEVQYEGTAQIVSIEELGDRLKLHFQKIPAAQKRQNDPNQGWILIKPSWVRLVDASQGPVKYEEVKI